MPPKPKSPSRNKSPKKKQEVDPEENVKLLRKFLKIYEQSCQTNHGKPITSLVQRITKLIKSEEGPSSPVIPIIVDEECTLPTLKSLIEALTQYQHYTHLSFWRASLGDEGCLLLGNWIRPHPTLKTLELMDNRLGPKSMHSLSRALQHNECLTELILDYNDLGDEGASVLSVGVSWNPSLTKLSLKYCSIGEDGGCSIGSEIVGKSNSLKDLDLQGNALGPKGVGVIALSLKQNNKLQKLNLADTSFGHDLNAVRTLADCLKQNGTLNELNLHLNTLNEDGAKALLEAVKTQKNLQTIQLYEKLDTQLFQDIMDAADLNKRAGSKSPKKKKGGKKKKK